MNTLTAQDNERQIGYPQVIARCLEIDGRQVLVRLHKPWQGDISDIKVEVPVQTILIVESWSLSTKSVVSVEITRPPKVSEEQFSYGVRYMMNHASDLQLITIIKNRKAEGIIKFTCGKLDSSVLKGKDNG
jgi:hypothetical protein